MTIKTSLERALYDIANRYGVRIKSLNVEYIDVSTPGEDAGLIRSINVEAEIIQENPKEDMFCVEAPSILRKQAD